MSMTAIRRALKLAMRNVGKDGVNALTGAALGAGASAATGGDADNMKQMALSGGLIGGNARAMKRIAIDVARRRGASGAAKKAATRTNNAAPVSAVKVKRNEMAAPGGAGMSESARLRKVADLKRMIDSGGRDRKSVLLDELDDFLTPAERASLPRKYRRK